jgi:8-oxo-dGTP diphosphatase
MNYTKQASGLHCYAYPHPAVTTDIVVFTLRENHLEVLLIQRGSPPFQGQWALPGGFLEIDEDLDVGAARELVEETGVSDLYLEQLYTFGGKDRDPRERVITVAYLALVPTEKLKPVAGSDAAAVGWHPVDQLPPLAFDHHAIIDTARARLSAKSRYSTIACQLLPPQFTLGELQAVYEVLRGESLDKRNFRKWILSLDCIRETGEMRRNGQRRPARLYRAIHPDTVTVFK